MRKQINQSFGWCPTNIINDESISLKAKGLWLYINSKPESWKFTVAGVQAQTKDGRGSIDSGLSELENAGYLIREQENNDGKFGSNEWILTDCKKPVIGKSVIGKSVIGKSLTSKTVNSKNINSKIEKRKGKFEIPSIKEIKSYCLERKNTIDAENFFNFYSAKGWLIGKSKMKDWKACVRTWEQREKKSTKKEVNYEKF